MDRIDYRMKVQALTGNYRSRRERDLLDASYTMADDNPNIAAQWIWAHRISVREGEITTPNGGALADYFDTRRVRAGMRDHFIQHAASLKARIWTPNAVMVAKQHARNLEAPASYAQPRRGMTQYEWNAKRAIDQLGFEVPSRLPNFRCWTRPIVSPPAIAPLDTDFLQKWINHNLGEPYRTKTLVDILKELGCDDFHMQANYQAGIYYVWCDPRFHRPAAAEFEHYRTIGTQVVFNAFTPALRALTTQIGSDAKEKVALTEQRDAAHKRAYEAAGKVDDTFNSMAARLQAAYAALDAAKKWASRLNTGYTYADQRDAGESLLTLLQQHGVH
jgi:hypothetical protein